MKKYGRFSNAENVEERTSTCESTSTNHRRSELFKLAAVCVAAGLAGSPRVIAGKAVEGGPESDLPQSGDFLVPEPACGGPVPYKVSDIPIGKPILAYPMQPRDSVVRSATRMNKVLLLRFEESKLPAELAPVAAKGVLGFSAICPHHGCEVDTRLGRDGLLTCPCHGSMFRPLDAGSVAAGPAPRNLPVLPLTEKDGIIVVADAFSEPPGF